MTAIECGWVAVRITVGIVLVLRNQVDRKMLNTDGATKPTLLDNTPAPEALPPPDHRRPQTTPDRMNARH
ncbi:hypothetical protein [Burkholderia metallica]|uniref:hypothetical protein n=1 Tax=Burkholderia metallica TaxID=488729 RepID=UPI001CF3C2DD|nr:hypothetical protein [Burkholderia metallica]MCA8018916.1 hypothetical protein [Burkholderia metallica]